MGLFDSLFTKKEQNKELKGYWQTLTAYRPSFTSWDGQLYESELVRSAIDSRARHVSKLKVEMLGAAQPRLKTKLKQRPNEFQTWSQFLYRTSTILDMHNTAFIVPLYDRNLNIVGYYTALPSQCAVLSDNNNNPWLKYTFSNGESACIELSRCGVLTKFQYKDDVFGTSNNALSDTMKLIDMQNQGITEAIKNSATYRFMAQANNFAKPSDLAKERQRFSNENFSSDSNGGGLLLFPNTYTNIKQIESKPYTVDSTQRELIQQNIFNYFGVNDDVLQNKTFGDSWNAFYEGCIEPFSIQLSEVLTRMTFTETERSFGAEIIATASRLQYMSSKDKLNLSAQMADRGIMTINEIREMWNLPAVQGGDIRTIRGEYYQYNEDGTTTTKEDDNTTGKEEQEDEQYNGED